MGDGIKDPISYAREKLPTLRDRWSGAMGEALRVHGPTLWPWMPLPALMGLSASSMGAHEVGSSPDWATGLYGVEAKRLPDLCREASEYLQRPVSAKPVRSTYRDAAGVERPHYLEDVEGQVVTGLINYRKHLRALQDATDPALWREEAPVSSWALRCAAAAYSSGPRRPRAVLRELRAELVARAPSERWLHSAERVASWPRRTMGGEVIRGKWRLAFMELRADQRAMSGLALELELFGRERARVEWFAPWADTHGDLVGRLQALADYRSAP